MVLEPLPGYGTSYTGTCPTCGRARRWTASREFRAGTETQERAAYQREQARAARDRQREYASLVARGEAPPITASGRVRCLYCHFKGTVEFSGPRSDEPLDGQCPSCDVRMQWDPARSIQLFPDVTNVIRRDPPEPTPRERVADGVKKGVEWSLVGFYGILIAIVWLLGALLVISMIFSGGGGEEGCTDYGGPASGQC